MNLLKYGFLATFQKAFVDKISISYQSCSHKNTFKQNEKMSRLKLLKNEEKTFLLNIRR